MLLIKNHRLYCAGISFQLAEGLYLDTDSDMPCEDGVCMRAIDDSFTIDLHVDCRAEDARQNLEDIVYGGLENCTVLKSITPIELNGLRGYDCQYKQTKVQYYEAELDIGKKGKQNLVLDLCITTFNKVSIEAVLQMPEIKAFINGIRKEIE